eukprot:2316238-Prymnesium_polylepis.1
MHATTRRSHLDRRNGPDPPGYASAPRLGSVRAGRRASSAPSALSEKRGKASSCSAAKTTACKPSNMSTPV